MMPYFSIQVNKKLNVEGEKCNKSYNLGCKTYIRKIYGAKCNQGYSLGW